MLIPWFVPLNQDELSRSVIGISLRCDVPVGQELSLKSNKLRELPQSWDAKLRRDRSYGETSW